jgi:hypothetical protein
MYARHLLVQKETAQLVRSLLCSNAGIVFAPLVPEMEDGIAISDL